MSVALSEPKQTAWPVIELDNVLSEPPRYGINAPAVPHDGILPTYLRITDISPDGYFKPSPAVAVDDQAADKYFLAPGDILVARTGASVGKSYLHKAANGELVYAGFLLRLRCDPHIMDPRFLAAFMRTHEYWTWVGRESARSGQPGLNAKQFASLTVPCPSIREQQAIAGVLSDVDDLIDALDQLIEKKMMVRIGAAQSLLSGKRRLPGYQSVRKTTRLGDVATIRSGGTPSTRQSSYFGGDIPWLSISDVTSTTKYVRQTERTLTENGLAISSAVLFPVGTLMYAMYASVGESAIAEVEMASSQAILGIVCDGVNLDTEYAYYQLGAKKADLAAQAQRGTQANLNAGMVRDFAFELPPIDEQKAIAKVLSDMDAEIEALVARRKKTDMVKQAMMHELLTGKTRLV